MAASTPSLPELAKKTFREPAARKPAEPPPEFAGKFGNMRLNHRRPAALEFLSQGSDHRGMVVADVVNAVSREKVENAVFVESNSSLPMQCS